MHGKAGVRRGKCSGGGGDASKLGQYTCFLTHCKNDLPSPQ